MLNRFYQPGPDELKQLIEQKYEYKVPTCPVNGCAVCDSDKPIL